MGRNSNSLQHELLRRVLPDIENNKTSAAYKRHIKNFAKWAKSNGYKKPESITVEVIQEYENYLENNPTIWKIIHETIRLQQYIPI